MNRSILSILFLLGHIPTFSQVDYKAQIEPIFYDKCSGCHTSGGSSGGLDLTSYNTLMAGGNSGASIVAGDNQNSLLWKRINDGSMPPSLNDVIPSNVELVKKWINEGALEKPSTQKNEITQIDNFSIPEDSMKTLILEANDLLGNAVTFEVKSSNQNINISLVSDTLTIKPKSDWNGFATITAYALGSTWKDSSIFIVNVEPVNDTPKPFFWNTVKSDTINITKDNLTSTYDLDWTVSVDVDGDSIVYILFASTGPSLKVEVYRTFNTMHLIPYSDFLQKTFEQVPVATSATVYFTVIAYDGTDSVKISRGDRELYINRYEYLSVDSQVIPDEFALHDNYPNPFNPSTQIRFDLPKITNASLTIYNMLGQRVKTFYMQNTPAGYQSITWNGTSDLDVPLAAGVYLYQLQTEEFVKTKKMILLK